MRLASILLMEKVINMGVQALLRTALAGSLVGGLVQAALLGTASAQSAAQPFTTQIFVQNPNSAPAAVVVNFYTELTGALQSVAPSYNLNANGSTIILVGSLSLSSPWRGSAVISSDQPVVAASMQVPPSGFGHIMANAFTSDQASSSYFLTTFLRNFGNEVSVLAIQNTENQAITIHTLFVDTSGNPVVDEFLNLPPFASKIYDANVSSTLPPSLPNPFNGSAVITATKGGGQPALIVATSETRRVDTDPLLSGRAYGFEAIPSSAGATTLFMPTALCRFGAGEQTTFFAIQNLSSSAPAVITVTYASGTNQPAPQVNTNVQPFAKWSVNPCQSNGNQPYSGAATIQSNRPIAAVGKASQTSGSPTRFVTAFIAQGSGSRRVAFPYVRWSPSSPGTDFRTSIAIQNVGTAPIPSGQVVVRYYDPSGNLVNTCTSALPMAVGDKLNSNVAAAFAGGTQFNCTAVQTGNGASYSFLGSAVVEGPSGAQLLAIARNSTPSASTSIHTEDFNGIPLP